MARLFVEELKAAMRGRFAWLGLAVVSLGVGGLAAAATQDTWLDGYGIIAYFLVPLTFIPLSAGMIASPRANRFVESVFTAPVERRDWFVAKILVLITLAAGYYLSLLPMMFVFTSHVGWPALLIKFLWWTPGLLIVSIAVGTLVGVMFIGRSIAAPTATGMGILLVYAGLAPLQELVVSQGNGAGRVGALTLVSPAVLLKNALGFTLVTGSIPSSTSLTWLSIGVIVIGTFTLASWVFLKAQGVETWEASRAQRWTIAASIVALLSFPSLVGDRNYDRTAPPTSNAPAIRGLFSRGTSALALTEPGRSLPSRCCGTILNRDEWPLGTDETTRRDLLILFPVDATQPIPDITVVTLDISGGNGLQVMRDPADLAPKFETRTYANDLGPAAADGHHVVTGWVERVPVLINPTKPWDLGGNRYPIDVNVAYRVAGDPAIRSLKARAAIEAQVSRAVYEMSAAGALLPLFCFAAAIVRWRRTR